MRAAHLGILLAGMWHRPPGLCSTGREVCATLNAAQLPARHLLAVESTSLNTSATDPVGELLLLDRETGLQLARFDFAGRAYAPAATPDGKGLYVIVAGPQPGIGIVDLVTLTMRSFLPVQAGGFTPADNRILLQGSLAVVAVDKDATRVLASVPCPGQPEAIVYNGTTGYAYASMIGRQDICVITPDLDPAAPIAAPVGPHQFIDNLVLADDRFLLATTADTFGQYHTAALDLADGQTRNVPSLDGVYPTSTSPDDPAVIFGISSGGVGAYRLTLAADGGLIFTLDRSIPAGVSDDRYVYAAVVGECSTIEGPVVCSVGFRELDRATGAEVRSFIFAQQTSFGLYGPRNVALTLSVPRPFGAAPSRRSRE